MSSVNSIRQDLRHKRSLMGCGAQKSASYRLAQSIIKTSVYQKSRHIAVYWAVNGEIDLRFLIKKAWSQGKACYLPVIDQEQLLFVHYTPASITKLNAFGIPEPIDGGIIRAENLDLVLMPLTAFDKQNHRIGMGGGYYDRTFSQARSCQHTCLMGVAHRCQQVHEIKPEPWDVVLDDVVTD